ncbi:nuclear transport factor 2 family protein [Paraburkholderia sp. Cy-641]|uniref:nuclear transport factor 2 family protein n=1 Tax=Paraburkholderia sp. Cy-641 TaxID=2608337 RepID=UPI00141FA73A|nr:nuclear transport factor 2 family protein [Paraburkholderia sp. Cy-641]NIF77121.1 nuclear transport factor 2 family protein [Paraburkholderia sp. Cy-641]
MSDENQAIEQVQQLEDARYAAMVSKDIPTLDRLLDDKLIYMHSSGVADTKSSYLEGLRTGVWDYHGIDRTELRYQIDGDIVLVFGKLAIRMMIRGVFKAFESRALAVWVRKREGWRLLAVQSGVIPGVC